VKLDNYPRPFTYTPQPNRIPTIESAIENLKKKGLFKKVKNLNKEENLEKKIKEREKPVDVEEIPKRKYQQQVIEEKEPKKGKDLSL